jgi:alpha-1,6-mannosyltransferase
VTEFYSERGGGVRSHLTAKGGVSRELGHEHVIVAPGPRDESGRSTEGTARGAAPRLLRVAGPPLPYDPTYHLLWRVDKVVGAIRSERPDVLEIHSPYAAAAACLSVPRGSFGVRTFVWHADFIDTYLRPFLERGVGLGERTASAWLEPLWRVVRFIASRCDATFVAGRTLEEKLLRHGIPGVVRVPFGVDRGCFSPSAQSDAVRRALLGDGDDRPLLVGMGRFAVEKRWDVVLDAFEELRSETPCTLVLFGDGPERKAIEARAARLSGDLRLMGFEADRRKLASALASADVLVHGCPYETFGFAVAEAMSSGLPAVVPDAGGAAELAEGGWAERYAAGDARACASALRTMLARLRGEGRAHLGERAARAAERLPTVRAHFEAMFESYARLLRPRGVRSPLGLSSSV